MYQLLYRHILFPAFDRWKGRKTVSYWKEFERTQWLSQPEHEARQVLALRNLLQHAASTTPYYANLFQEQGLRPDSVESLADFCSWPLLERETIRARRMELRSSQFPRLMKKATGGSSGVPLEFDLNSDSNDRRTALMIRGYSWANCGLGAKQFHLWGAPTGKMSSWKRAKLALHAVFERKKLVNCFGFDEQEMIKAAEDLARYRPDAIVAYTNPLYEWARFLESKNYRPFSPKGIIVGAEKLHDFQREVIERVFGTQVFETYGSREFMLIGAECSLHQGLHLSQENLIVEILNDDGTPTPRGEVGNVVITDLYNLGMPFIRYVNGDQAVAGWSECGCGRGLPLMRKVTGRRLDTLLTADGRKIAGEFFPHCIKDYAEVKRFQVVQDRPEQIRLYYIAPELSQDRLDEIRDQLELQIGSATSLEMIGVNEIPLTRAGKHQVVINRIPSTTRPAENLAVGACT